LEGLTMEKQHSRRAALDALAGLPALAILPAAASPSTTRLSALIEAHRAAWASFARATEALEAAEPDPDRRVSYLGRELCAIGHSSREDLISEMEVVFQFELKKLSTLSGLSPEMGKAACGALETGRAAYLAQLDEVFAGHMAAEEVWRAALASAGRGGNRGVRLTIAPALSDRPPGRLGGRLILCDEIGIVTPGGGISVSPRTSSVAPVSSRPYHPRSRRSAVL
jgi:hypothetical protein